MHSLHVFAHFSSFLSHAAWSQISLKFAVSTQGVVLLPPTVFSDNSHILRGHILFFIFSEPTFISDFGIIQKRADFVS